MRNESESFSLVMHWSDQCRLTGQHHRLHPLGGFRPFGIVGRIGQLGLSDTGSHVVDTW